MYWNKLHHLAQLEQIDFESEQQKILIYKHSDRCGVCTSVKNHLEKEWDSGSGIKPYLVDVIKDRNISSGIAQRYGITHESPQAILIRDRKPVFQASHFDIDYREILNKGQSS